jgi:hypothetical protein
LIGFEPLKVAHIGEYIADILYNVLERFSIIKQFLCIMTDNTGNNGTMRKELEELLNNLDVNNSWSTEATVKSLRTGRTPPKRHPAGIFAGFWRF